MWRLPGCGGPWAAFSSGAVEAHPTLEILNIKGDKTYVEVPGQSSVFLYMHHPTDRIAHTTAFVKTG